MPGLAVYGGHPAWHPTGRCCATSAHHDRLQIKQRPSLSTGALRFNDAGSSLSHGETPLPSALRFSLLSSAWGRVGTTALVPPGRIPVPKRIFYTDAALAAFSKVSHILLCSFPFLHLPPCLSVKSFVRKSGIGAENHLSSRQNIFGVVRLSLTVH